MKNTQRVLCTVLLLGLAGFSLLGFMATFEPMGAALQFRWRVVYGVLISLSMAGIARLNY